MNISTNLKMQPVVHIVKRSSRSWLLLQEIACPADAGSHVC